MQRLTEDHGVCLSSCLDYWEDDLVLQAFNRCLILAPEIYGNYTYYIPVTDEMVGRPLEAFALLLKGGNPDLRVTAWLTAYPIPLVSQEVIVMKQE